MSDGLLATEREGLAADRNELAQRALAVLEANWLGHATKPSPTLYPHQWSWDSACIAMGYSAWNQKRAESELRSLFAGQWRNGLLPHIVFTDGARYFPGPEFWQTERSADAPDRPRTSGIVQPPIHATAALRVYERARDRGRATAFLEQLLPHLRAWHEYLYRERSRSDDGLVEIWHPWESGMDNSPLWDAALARITLGPGQVPVYQRVDVQLADASERSPFAIQPVLFNSLLVQANRDLAEIARVAGAEAAPFEERAEQTAAGIEARLWDDEHVLYADFDVLSGEHVPARSAAGLAPLYASVPSRERAARMVEELGGSRVDVGDNGFAVTSLAPDDPGFDPTRYWRGPVWPILNWVLQRGLDRYGYAALASQVRSALIELAQTGGFWEHYNPTTRRGHGGEQFAWTAGLVLDVLATEEEGARV
jgi:glycogen debranching enzyme